MSSEAVDWEPDRLQWRSIRNCGAARSGSAARWLAGALILIAAAAHGGQALAHPRLLEVRGATPEARAAALHEALLATARLKQLHPTEAVTIRLHGGEYRLASPLLITPNLSGTPGAPTMILAAPGEQPRLSGARAVQPAWSREGADILRAPVPGPGFDRLYVDGRRQVRARYPNFDATIKPLGGYAADAIAPERIARWKDPTGGVVHALHVGRWGDVHVPILGKDANGALLFGPETGNNRPSLPHERFRFVENIHEELDARREWYYDARAQALFYYPDSEHARSATYEVSRLETLIEVRGSERVPVHDLVIRGLAYSQTAETFLDTREPLLRSDWMFARKAAVLVEGATDLTIEAGEFFDLGGNAVVVSGFNRRVRVLNNEFRDIGASAIAFVGRPEAVRSPRFNYDAPAAYASVDRAAGPASSAYPADCQADGNLIHDIGTVEKQVAGVQIAMAMNIIVRHNTIYDVPRAGINVGDGTWGGHLIEYNDVFDTVLETGDHGAINAWGRDRYWSPDRAEMDAQVERDPGAWKLDAVTPVVIRHNRFRSDHGWDIDLDDGASNYRIYDNVCLAGGLKLREGFGREVSNNIILNNGFHPHVWFKGSADRFEHNIVMAAHTPILMSHWDGVIDRNLFATRSMLAAAHAISTDAHSAYGDPRFIDSRHGNYQVRRGSPALALGFRNFRTDDFGITRPALRARARAPVLPIELIVQEQGASVRVSVDGLTLKSVESLGEQSAAGLAEQSGALVTRADPGSIWERAGLRSGDVILACLDEYDHALKPVVSAADFLAAYRSRKWRGSLDLQIQRDQRPQILHVELQ
ncbi:MAG TPA: PDZ domain-containing protein [Steroidobacteraceae bacterium]|nr:PDZ domain-containing protein [Steroidobacteraceae bacterium]